MSDQNTNTLREYFKQNKGKLIRLDGGASVLFHTEPSIGHRVTITIGAVGRPTLDWMCVLTENDQTVIAKYMRFPGEIAFAFEDGDASDPEALLGRLALFLGREWCQRTKSEIATAALRLPDGSVVSVPRPQRHRQAVQQAQINIVAAGGNAATVSGMLGYVLGDGAFVDAGTAYSIAVLSGQGGPDLGARVDAKLLSEDLW